MSNAERFLLPLLVLAPYLAQSGEAKAEARPVTTFEWVDSSMADIAEPNGHTSKIIFLNRCEGGCTISRGFNDSRTNRSTIVPPGTYTISEWNKGDSQWEDLVSCVKALYDPYDIVITDVDPGSSVEHFEAIVAGRANEAAMDQGVGGVAPFSCGVINNAITLNFANENFYSQGIKDICETVGQETAHAFGLEHEYLCTDPMTYLSGCGYKWFQNENASCGEYSPASCQCRNNQNSHRLLEDHFGVGPNPGPNLTFVRPEANSNVSPNFVIEVSGDDYYYGLNNVEILVNGQSTGTMSSAPYIFNAPEGTNGFTTIEVRGTDARGITSEKEIEVNVGESCDAGGCPTGRVCFNNFCIADSSTPGGFAASCDSDDTCNSEICARDEDGVGSCTETCELDKGQCPDGYGCLKAGGGTNVCWPGVTEDTGCGCSSTNPGGGLAGLLLGLLGLVYQRRRRHS
ncbi:MAG: hypothetical protein GY811_23880 [Myxococcales bacterium]|nr:hypothetical protein [Myxococcales bacterium]